jgi:hypothetical protein
VAVLSVQVALCSQSGLEQPTVKAKAGQKLSGLCGDKVYTPSPRRSEVQRDLLVEMLSGSLCGQNLSAKPKRTAKLLFDHQSPGRQG